MALIPVQRRWPLDLTDSRSFMGAPCVDLQYTFEPTARLENGSTQLVGLHQCWALIDTGADLCTIDASLIPASVNPIEYLEHSGVNGSERAGNYELSIFFPQTSWTVQLGAVAMAHRSYRPYGMILGRRFLELVTFAWNGADGIVAMEPLGSRAPS